VKIEQSKINKLGLISDFDPGSPIRRSLVDANLYSFGKKVHPGICVTFDRRTHGIDCQIPSTHPGLEFSWPTLGPFRKKLRGKNVALNLSQFSIYNGLETHTEIYNGETEHHRAIVVTNSYLESLFKEFDFNPKNVAFDDVVFNATSAMTSLTRDLFENRLVPNDFVFDCIVSSLLIEVFTKFPGTFSDKITRFGSQGRFPGAITKAKRLLMEMYPSQTLNLDELSKLSGMSKFQFIRSFKASTGQTPMRYLGELRMGLAKNKLVTTKQPICDLSLSLGFSDLSVFYRNFKAAVGVTPHVYRKMSLRA